MGEGMSGQSVLHNAERRLAEIDNEAKRLRRFIVQYREFAGLGRSPAARKTNNPGMPNAVAQVAERILRDTGRPMRRGELAAAIEETGFVLPSVKKSTYVGTILIRMPGRFVHVHGAGYWLTDEPVCNATGQSVAKSVASP
jgi:hypothetical protein